MILADDQNPVTVVLDLMYPVRPVRHLLSGRCQTKFIGHTHGNKPPLGILRIWNKRDWVGLLRCSGRQPPRVPE